MSLFNSYDRTKQLSELAIPYEVGSGVVSAATQRQNALRNITGSATFTIAQFTVLDNVTAGTAAASKALVLDANKQVGQFVNSLGYIKQAAPAAKTTSTTLTAAELLGRLLTGNQGGGAAATYTLPLATDLETAIAAQVPAQNDLAFDWTLINLSVVAAEDITIATNTGWTLVGKMTVESNDAVTSDARGTFRVRRTAANTYTLYRVG